MGLTIKRIERLISEAEREIETNPDFKGRRFRDERGLYLQVRGAENSCWLLRYKFQKRERLMGLGPLELVDLEAARARAFEARKLLSAGVDPLAERAKEKAARVAETHRNLSFETVAQQYFDQHQAKWRNKKHRQQFLSTLKRYAFPLLGSMPVADIERRDVLAVLEKDNFWQSKHETADRVRGRIETVLDFAAARDLRNEKNPARWRNNLALILPKIGADKHHAALPYAEVAGFMVKLRKRSGTAAKALEFLILTASRTGEVIGAQWDEINLPEKIWTIPGSRMKAGREHRVPLTDEAIAVLNSLTRDEENEFVFRGERKVCLSCMAMSTLLRRIEMDEITIHGFRATFRTWAAEKTSIASDIAEAALAHAPKNQIIAVYQRGDLLERRRELMRVWARFVSEPFCGANVLPMKVATL